MNRRTFKCAFRASLPVLAGYMVLGIGFGLLLQQQGFAWWWSGIMSLAVFAGSMQYMAVDLLGAGASLITFAAMTLFVNARHLFYGIPMISKYKNRGKVKPFLMFWLSDETFSIMCDDIPEGVDETRYMLYVSALNYSYWFVGSIMGGIAGTLIPFDFKGVEFSMTALFVVVFVNQWEKKENRLSAITGLVVTIICLLIFGKTGFLIPTMIFLTVALLVEKHIIESREKEVRDEQ